MKKNIREDKRFGEQFAYILDCIDVENENGDINEEATDKEKIEYVFNRFDKEFCYPYNLQRYPNEQQRLKEWFAGLAIGIAYSNYDIEQLGKQWGFCQTEKKAALFVERWFSTMALRLLQLRDRLCK